MLILKGRRDGVSIVIHEHTQIEQTITQLREKLQETGDFFRGAAFQLEMGDRELTREEFEAISVAAEEFGVSLKEPSPRRRTGDGSLRSRSSPRGFNDGAGFTVKRGRDIFQGDLDRGSVGGTEFISDETLLLRRTVRSGQRIEYNGNIVVMGDVNGGAVITCTGDIIVLGSLRGVAHAGAEGNEDAVVLAFRLEPTQLRIAHYISRSPDESEPGPKGPEMARVQDGMILIETYVP